MVGIEIAKEIPERMKGYRNTAQGGIIDQYDKDYCIGLLDRNDQAKCFIFYKDVEILLIYFMSLLNILFDYKIIFCQK